MNSESESENSYEEIKEALKWLREQDSIGKTDKHPDRTDNCLPLNRVFVAIDLTPEEIKHLDKCLFCQRQVKSFKNKVPLELRRTIPIPEKTEKKTFIDEKETRIIKFMKPLMQQRPSWTAAAATILVCVSLAVAGSVSFRKLSVMLAEATQHRQRLELLHEATGVGHAFDVDFDAEQPNIARLTININPALVRLSAVTYDNGENWETLYSKSVGDILTAKTFEPTITVKDQQTFIIPPSGKQSIKALVHVEYVPEVIAAFPEYKKPEKTDRISLYEITPTGIRKLASKITGVATAKAEVSMGIIPLDADRWEALNSPNAYVNLENDPVDSAVIQQFKLGAVGEYTNIGHAIPSATPEKPTVSLEELTGMEIQFLWDGNAPIILEPKLVDDHGKIIGMTKFIEPSSNSQTIWIPAHSLKGYFGIRIFGYSRVRRFDLAVVRKVKSHASEGIIKIQRIELFGTAELPPPPTTTAAEQILLAELSLDPAQWKTAHSERGTIELSAEDKLLVCKVELPYNQELDKTLPWTNLEIPLEQRDFSKLKVIEIELMWQGPAPITIEPKLVTSVRGDTYGRQIRIQPANQFHKVKVYLHDLKYYWSLTGTTKETKMNLYELNTISLGIARKAQDQAQQGTLYIEAIYLLGLEQQKE